MVKKKALSGAIVVLCCCLIACGIGSCVPLSEPVRYMPSEVEQGECFNVTINFTLPLDSVMIFLYDTPPSGWNISAIVSSEPPAKKETKDSKVAFVWEMPHSGTVVETNFSVTYTVCVPEDATPGRYRFVGNLTYFDHNLIPHTISIKNDYIFIKAPAAVPTVSPIGMILMSLLLAAAAVIGIRKKHM